MIFSTKKPIGFHSNKERIYDESSIIHLTVLGNNPAFTTIETLTSIGTVVFPASVAATTISSGSTNDTSAGTGARTVKVTYLDSSYAQTTETLTMNGQTGVTLSGQPLRVLDMEVMTAGSGVKNAGIIYVGTGSVTTGVPAVVIAGILTSDNRMSALTYTVPAGKSLFIESLSIGTSDITAVTLTEGEVIVDLNIRDNAGSALVQRIMSATISSGDREFLFDKGLILPAKTDIWINVTGATAAKANAILNGYLLTDGI